MVSIFQDTVPHARRTARLMWKSIIYAIRNPRVFVVSLVALSWGLSITGVFVFSLQYLPPLPDSDGILATAIVDVLRVFYTVLLFVTLQSIVFTVFAWKSATAAYVAGRVSSERDIGLTDISQNLIHRTPQLFIGSVGYTVSVFGFILTLGGTFYSDPDRISSFPSTVLVPPALILEEKSVRETVSLAKTRFTTQWDDFQTKFVGFWTLPVILIWTAPFGVVLPLIGAPNRLASILAVAFVPSVVIAATIPIVDGCLYSHTRGWEVPDPFDKETLQSLFE